jgi:hypothetical protein
MTREKKIKILAKAMAQDMMEEYSARQMRDCLGPICDSADVVVFEYAKLYWESKYSKNTDEELNECWWWLADYKHEIDGEKNE